MTNDRSVLMMSTVIIEIQILRRNNIYLLC